MKATKDKLVLTFTAEQRKTLKQFEKRIGIRFRNLNLLGQAFSHSSLQSEHGKIAHNEKLEFLGDSVLGLVVTEYLYRSFPQSNEGQLAKIKAFVVSEDSLVSVAEKLDIGRYILVGKSEERSGGRSKKAILADALEALIGAYYVDAGFTRTQNFILHNFESEITNVIENRHKLDYKSLLQEYVQKKQHTYPKYDLVRKTGPDHAQVFWVQVKVNDKNFGPVSGMSKKEAEKRAAELAYKWIFEANNASKREERE